MAISNVSPGVYTQELDFSLYTARLATAIFGVVGAATRGKVNSLTLLSNEGTLEETFGPAAPSVAEDEDGVRIGGTQALYHAKHFLKNGSILYFVRVAGDNLAYASLQLDNVGTYYGGSYSGTPVLEAVAITPGTWANSQVSLQIVHINATTYTLSVYYQGQKVESYPNITQANVESSVNGVSQYITVTVLDSSQIPGETLDPVTAKAITVGLGDGDDGLYASTQGTAGYPHIKDAANNDTLKIVALREGDLANADESDLTRGFYVRLDETTVLGTTYLRIGAYYDGSLIPGEEYLATTKAALITAVNAESNWFNLEDITTGLQPDASVATNYGLTGGMTVGDVIGTQVGKTVTGLQNFRNDELIDINILAAPGQFHLPVINEIVDIAETRQDTISLVASPFDLSVNEMIDWHNGNYTAEAEVPMPPISALNSSYATLIYQWIRTYDSYNDVSVWTSSEGAHASMMAFTDDVSEPWFAPAGLNRARPSWIEDITYSPRRDERELLYGNPGTGQNAINPWVNFRAQGITLWGQRTLQRAPTALDRINVRRLLNVLKKTISTSTRYLVFDPNDATLWAQWGMLVRPYLRSVQARRGLIDWEAQMDATTTTPLDIDRNTAVGRIFIQPTKAAEIIVLQFILTPTGASFDEILGNR